MNCLIKSATWSISLTSSLIMHPVLAQVVTDGSVGAARAIPGPNMTIGAELGTTKGANLFHSFQSFNIQKGESATFTGPAQIQNVISRVTGGKTSTLDGTLRSQVGKADVYLINPSGIVMGPNAQIDVPAAFHASTADELRFSDGSVYSASDPGASTLTIAPPESFGFLSPQPATITVNGSKLEFKPGQTATFSAGDVTINQGASLTSSGGRIKTTAVGTNQDQVSVHGDDDPRGGGTLTIEDSNVDVSGINGDKTINLNASKINVLNSKIMADHWGNAYSAGRIQATSDQMQVVNSRIRSRNYGEGRGNDIVITAEDLTIDAATAADGASNLQTRVMSGAHGSAGDISLDVTNLTLSNGGQISSIADEGSFGATGAIKLKARDLLLLDGSNATGLASGLGNVNLSTSGISGSIIIDAPTASLKIQNGAFLQTVNQGIGSAGDIRLTVHDLELGQQASIFAGTFGDGNAGAVMINAASSTVLDGGKIWAGTYGVGQAGSITITSPIIELNDESVITANTKGKGAAGEINLIASDAVRLTNESAIQAFSGTSEDDEPYLGNAGKIKIETGSLSLLDSSLDVFSANLANAGSIEVFAQRIQSDNTPKTDGTFDGKTVFSAENTGGHWYTLDSEFSVAEQGRSGQITLNASEIVLDHASKIDISTSTGDGGAVSVRADNLTLLNGSEIFAPTSGPGRGGQVDVNVTGNFLIEGGYNPIVGITMDGGITTAPISLSVIDPAKTGPAGPLTISANTLTIGTYGLINAASDSNAAAGTVSIDVESLEIRDGGEIYSGTMFSGTGAKINLNASEGIYIHGVNPFSQLSESKISADGSAEYTGSGGSINIKTPNLRIEQGGSITVIGDEGAGGNIFLDINNLTMFSGGQINSSTWGNAPAGEIKINATSISLNGQDKPWFAFDTTGIFNETRGAGNAGLINLNVKNLLELTSGAIISTNTDNSGNAGSIKVTAGSIKIDRNGSDYFTGLSSIADYSSSGRAGKISINSKGQIELLNGGQISTSTRSVGNAGDVYLHANDLFITGKAFAGRSPYLSGLFSAAMGGATGQVGNIIVDANTLTLSNGGKLSIESNQTLSTPELIHLDTHLTVNANQLTMNGGLITAESTGNVPAATLVINAHEARLTNGSRITTESQNADAGPIIIDGGWFWLDHSQVTTSANGQQGNGGDIVVNSKQLILDGGFIQANTAAQGAHGGDIYINSKALLMPGNQTLAIGELQRQVFDSVSQRNVIQAAAPGGEQGRIEVSGPLFDISSAIAGVHNPYRDPASLFRDPCAYFHTAHPSSLVDRMGGGAEIAPEKACSVPFIGERLDRALSAEKIVQKKSKQNPEPQQKKQQKKAKKNQRPFD